MIRTFWIGLAVVVFCMLSWFGAFITMVAGSGGQEPLKKE